MNKTSFAAGYIAGFEATNPALTLITLRNDLRHVIRLLGPGWEPMSREEIREMIVKALEKAQ